MDKTKNRYIKIHDLEIYKVARQLSKIGWEIYQNLSEQVKKISGNQFIQAVDSIGANITEGYLRFHYLEKNRFYYHARASLGEANDFWIEILHERKQIENTLYEKFKKIAKTLSIKINNFITANYQAKNDEK